MGMRALQDGGIHALQQARAGGLGYPSRGSALQQGAQPFGRLRASGAPLRYRAEGRVPTWGVSRV